MDTVLNEPELVASISIEFQGLTIILNAAGSLSQQQCIVRNQSGSACGLVNGVKQPLSIRGHPVRAVSSNNICFIRSTSASKLLAGEKLSRMASGSPSFLLVRHVHEDLIIASPLYSAPSQGHAQTGEQLKSSSSGTVLTVSAVTNNLVGIRCNAVVADGESLTIQDNTPCTCHVSHGSSDQWHYNMYFTVNGHITPAVIAAQAAPEITCDASGSSFNWSAQHAPTIATMHSKIGYSAVEPVAKLHRRCVRVVRLANGAYTPTTAVLQLRYHYRAMAASLDTTLSGDIIDLSLSAINDIPATELKANTLACTVAVQVANASAKLPTPPLTLLGIPGTGMVVKAGQYMFHALPSSAPRAFFDRSEVFASVSANNGTAILPLHHSKEERTCVVVSSGTGDRHSHRAAPPTAGSQVFPLKVESIDPAKLVNLWTLKCSLHYKRDGTEQELKYESTEVPFTAVVRVLRVLSVSRDK